MKNFLIIGLFAFVAGVLPSAATAQNQARDSMADKRKSFVLLELFTSEGCPTCPPADANLAFLEREQPFKDTEIVTLALHVDYWNSVNWKDIYSSPLFSRRQQLYTQALKVDQSYTPQMVVDGQNQFAGGNLAKAQKTILEAAKTPKASVEVTAATDKVKIKISDVPAHQNATVFLAITENALVSNRKTGAEPPHTSVVRILSPLGILAAAQKSLELETILPTQPEWKKDNLRIVVFVQENASRKILGVNRIALN